MRRCITKNRITALVAALVLICTAFLPNLSIAAGVDTIFIRTAEDYSSLVKKCKTDTWSQGRTVSLENDIDLSYGEFKPIPTFGGYFKGNGHTISGIKLEQKGSNLGFMRYIQKGAVVEDLNLRGEFYPDGSKKKIGGICGECDGIIKSCSFEGEVRGDASIGGICGYLTESGQIDSCRFNGGVTGKSYTGGICGQNYGVVKNCENNGRINVTDTEEEKSLQDKLENIDLNSDDKKLVSAENIDSATDTGGICGFSKGSIYGCVNYGNVGYASVGYNTGGICGRQSGSVSECRNYGKINGRKDVGGISGQAEPYILLEYTEDALVKLNGIVDKIQAIIDADEVFSGDELSNCLDDIGDSAENVSNAAEAVTKTTEDYADKISDEVNSLADRLSDALESVTDAFDCISDGGKMLADSVDGLEDAADLIKEILDKTEDAAEDAENAGTHLKNASSDFEKASARISDSCESLEEGANDMEEGFDALKTAIADLRKALDEKNDIEGKEKNVADAVGTIRGGLIDVSDALSDIASALKDLADKGYDIGELKELISKFKDLAGAYKNTAVALGEIADAFLVIAEGFDMDSVGTAFRILAKGFDFLSKGFAELKNAVNDIDKAVADMDGTTELLKNTVDIIKGSAVMLSDGIDKLSDGVGIISDTVKNFNDSGEFKLPSASEMFDDDIDGLFDGINELKRNFEALSDVLKTKKDGLSDEISDIEVQLKAITEVLTDTYDKYRDNDEESIIEDVSDTEGNIGLYGRIDSSYNYGDVSADLCAGGITGAMAIEYDFDPEDDIKSENTKSLDFTYKSKCVMRRCANHGRITSKKNYCGGIVGRMDLGSVVSCENCGNITSEDGDYIGGIAGISDTVVRSCAAKCEVGGRSFVGGVVGKAGEIYGCYAIANITGFDENGGAIAGGADLDNLKNNFYVNDFIGGADDISYSGKAQETDVSDFVRFVKGNFGTDVEFCLKFTADGKEIARVPFTYKEAIPDEKIPNVPKKSGYYGKWSYYDYSCAMFDAEITAEYYRDIELLPSDLKREDGKAAVLICGAFDDNAHVEAKKNTEIPAELGNKHITDSVSVLISGSYAENYIVRYLPLSEKNVNIYIQTESGIKKISTKKFGSYIEFETPSREFTIYETPKSGKVLILSASAGIILLILTLFYLNSKKRKRNSIDKSEDIN